MFKPRQEHEIPRKRAVRTAEKKHLLRRLGGVQSHSGITDRQQDVRSHLA